jgi:hypothetical protein
MLERDYGLIGRQLIGRSLSRQNIGCSLAGSTTSQSLGSMGSSLGSRSVGTSKYGRSVGNRIGWSLAASIGRSINRSLEKQHQLLSRRQQVAGKAASVDYSATAAPVGRSAASAAHSDTTVNKRSEASIGRKDRLMRTKQTFGSVNCPVRSSQRWLYKVTTISEGWLQGLLGEQGSINAH